MENNHTNSSKYILGAFFVLSVFLFSVVGAVTVLPMEGLAKDDNTNFGSSTNEALGIDVNLNLDELFAGDGLQYEYTVLDGGSFNGAASAIAVIDLFDGRHIVLFPGWGDRTGTHTLEFSDTLSVATSDSGDKVVDFVIYDSSWISSWSSNNEYGNWNFLKASGSSTGGVLPLIGDEVVTRVAIQHQAANTGQEDQIESMLVNGETYLPDVEGPTLSNTFLEPLYPTTSDLVTIKASFNDKSGVDKAEVKWSFFTVGDNLEYHTPGYIEMIESEGIFSSPAPIPSPITEGGFGEGYVEYSLRPYDLFGNHESTGVTENPFYFTYDDTAPQTSINILENEFITSETEIILTALDPDLDGAGNYVPSEVNFTTYQVDSNPAVNYTVPFFIIGDDGTHIVKFFSVDNAGNVESEKTITVNLDNTAPITTDDYQFDNVWVKTDQTITLTPSDDGSDLAWTRFCLILGCDPEGGTDYLEPVTISTEGIIHFRYASADNVGNVETTHEKIVKIDKTNPVTTINSPASGSWQNTDFQFDVTDTDTGGSELSLCEYQVKVGSNLIISKDWTVRNCSMPITITVGLSGDCNLEGEDMCQINVRAHDDAGNRGFTKFRKFSIDFTNPTIIDDYAHDGVWVNSPQIVTLTPLDTDGSGIASVFTCEEAECVPDTILVTSFALSFIESQDTIVRYQAFDVAGNPSVIGEFNVKIDLENPSVNITSPNSTDRMDFFIVKADVSDTGGSELENVTLTLKDSSGNIIVGLDNVQMVQISGTDKFEFLVRMWELEAGTYTFEVTATDNTGNVNLTTQEFTIIENVAPSRITSTNNQVSTETGGTVSFDFDVVVRNGGSIKFGMDDVIRIGDTTGFTPLSLNATVSNGTVNATVGSGIEFVGAEILELEDLDTETPNVQGTFTLYLDFPPNVVPGNYPINYFIDVA